ncbi:imidazolonepropionase [Aegicerativicinus sediminis]
MTVLIINIKQLVQVRQNNVTVVKGKEMADLPVLENAYLMIEHDTIVEFGPMSELDEIEADEIIDAKDRIVLPTWCDSHTHVVYAGNRVGEFEDRINGLSYEEIATRGGGILNSAKLLAETSEQELYEQSIKRIHKLIRLGTGLLEIKSGYGLSLDAELKMLRVIRKIKKELPITVKATYLAAHAVPKEYKDNKSAYVDLVVNEFIPTIAKEKLADYIDVFCEKGYFDVEDTEKILKAGVDHGLVPKIHVNQFNIIGGVEAAVQHNALSVDHLELLDDNDLEHLKGSRTMPVALPGCSFFLSIPYTPARKIIDIGLPLALATDYNPGSAPSGNMNFVVSAACIKMNMTPAEAINAATINGAYALGVSNQYGSICRGKKANVMITKEIPDYRYLPYSFGEDCIDKVLVHGMIWDL